MSSARTAGGGDLMAEINAKVIADIQSALGVIGYGADNFSRKNVACPFHDDKHPSASLHKEKGLWCHACARWYKWKELAQALGVQWYSSYSLKEVMDAFRYVSGALPSETRNGLIAAGLTDMARALDLFYHYADVMGEAFDFISIDVFTFCINAVVNYYGIPFDFTPRTYRKVFEQLQGKGLPKRAEFLRTFFPSFFSLQHIESKKPRKNSKRGRQEGRPRRDAWLWMPKDRIDLAPLAEALERDWFVDAGELAIEDYQTGQHYRAASTFQEVKDRPGKYARKQITASTRVSYPTLKPYAKLAGIVITAQPPKLEPLTREEVLQLPADHKELRLMIAQKIVKPGVFLQDERGNRHEYTKRGARRAVECGQLYRASYQASDYQPEETTDSERKMNNALDKIIRRKDGEMSRITHVDDIPSYKAAAR